MSKNDSSRIFSPEEISKILNEATQIQQGQTEDSHEGLTKSEIVELAKESGISEEAISRAIHNTEDPAIDTSFEAFNKSGKIIDISSLPIKATEEDWDEIARMLHTSTGHLGSVAKDEKSFKWFQSIGLSVFSASLETRDNKTQIQVMASLFGVKTLINIGVLLISLLGMFLFGAIMSGNLASGIFFGINLGVASWFILRGLVLKSYFDKQKQKVKELASSITKILGRRKSTGIAIEEQEQRAASAQNRSGSGNDLRIS